MNTDASGRFRDSRGVTEVGAVTLSVLLSPEPDEILNHLEDKGTGLTTDVETELGIPQGSSPISTSATTINPRRRSALQKQICAMVQKFGPS